MVIRILFFVHEELPFVHKFHLVFLDLSKQFVYYDIHDLAPIHEYFSTIAKVLDFYEKKLY